MFLERSVAVRIAIHVEGKPHFVIGRFPPRVRRNSRRCARELFCGLTRRAKFLPQRRSRRNLARGILALQRSQLPFQLTQRKRHVHFWCDKKRLNEKYQGNEEQYTADEQNEP